jgi:hypothetical protein
MKITMFYFGALPASICSIMERQIAVTADNINLSSLANPSQHQKYTLQHH